MGVGDKGHRRLALGSDQQYPGHGRHGLGTGAVGNSYVMKTPRPTLIMPFSILNVIFVSNLALKFSEIS